ncbi:hypothetical protein ACTXT7_005296 [Hymenolepis weldensis]
MLIIAAKAQAEFSGRNLLERRREFGAHRCTFSDEGNKPPQLLLVNKEAVEYETPGHLLSIRVKFC